MTDGPYLSLGTDCTCSEPDHAITLHNFSLWIELQPIETMTGILELLGNECYRRELFNVGNELKHLVSELRQ